MAIHPVHQRRQNYNVFLIAAEIGRLSNSIIQKGKRRLNVKIGFVVVDDVVIKGLVLLVELPEIGFGDEVIDER
jgi:hypothetical protein